MHDKKKILRSGAQGAVFGLIVGIIFCVVFTSLLNNANAYNDFITEVPFGFAKIIIVCISVPAIIFMLLPDDGFFRFKLSLIALSVVLVITFIVLVISTYGIANVILTVLMIAVLVGGGGRILIIIIEK